MPSPHSRCLALLLLPLIACQNGDAEVPQAPAPKSLSASQQSLAQPEATLAAPRIRLASSMAEAEAGNFRNAFSLFGQRDIVAELSFPQAALPTGPVLVHLEVLNSSGVAHASKWYAISALPEGPKSLRHPLFDRDLKVQPMQGSAAQPYFLGKIPFAGTNFTRNRLHGEFTARLSIGTEANAIASQVFEVSL